MLPGSRSFWIVIGIVVTRGDGVVVVARNGRRWRDGSRGGGQVIVAAGGGSGGGSGGSSGRGAHHPVDVVRMRSGRGQSHGQRCRRPITQRDLLESSRIIGLIGSGEMIYPKAPTAAAASRMILS